MEAPGRPPTAAAATAAAATEEMRRGGAPRRPGHRAWPPGCESCESWSLLLRHPNLTPSSPDASVACYAQGMATHSAPVLFFLLALASHLSIGAAQMAVPAATSIIVTQRTSAPGPAAGLTTLLEFDSLIANQAAPIQSYLLTGCAGTTSPYQVRRGGVAGRGGGAG